MKFDYPPGATPLDINEIEGLKPAHITTQMELNEWENANIIEAEKWALSKNYSYDNILTNHFIREVHKKMFNTTWKWAGTFRQTLKNIGCDPSQITTELKNLLEDVVYQIKHESYSTDEIAYRFHHRLVKIHPFPNGNGRHARLVTNMLLTSLKRPWFSWGKEHLTNSGVVRNQYILSLRNADKGDYRALSQFVRS